MRVRRQPSDLFDEPWALVLPYLPPAKSGGRPRTTEIRALFDAILYLLRTGCQWRQSASGLPSLADGAWLFPALANVGCLDPVASSVVSVGTLGGRP